MPCMLPWCISTVQLHYVYNIIHSDIQWPNSWYNWATPSIGRYSKLGCIHKTEEHPTIRYVMIPTLGIIALSSVVVTLHRSEDNRIMPKSYINVRITVRTCNDPRLIVVHNYYELKQWVIYTMYKITCMRSTICSEVNPASSRFFLFFFFCAGGVYYVYQGATHTRFEHSIG